jgi:hypothetical protein
MVVSPLSRTVNVHSEGVCDNGGIFPAVVRLAAKAGHIRHAQQPNLTILVLVSAQHATAV